MLQIGITGGIGSGKSVVARLFAALGVPVYDSDTRARWVMAHDLILREQLQAAFGTDTYDTAGQLNRPYLASVAFGDPDQLAKLNALVHPRVAEDYATWAADQAALGHAYILKEAALLFESGAYKTLDKIIALVAPREVRIARVLQRDPQRNIADVERIIAQQLPESELLTRADYVIYNDGTQLLIPQVLALHQQWSREE